MIDERIIVALDTSSRPEVERLCELLAGQVRMLKVGLGLFVAEGPRIVEEIRGRGFDVFLDLKLHDIPHQVELAAADIARLQVAMFTVHAAGGTQMLSDTVRSAREAAREHGVEPPKIVGVTILTSLSEQDLPATGVERGLRDQVTTMARQALDVGLDGVVTSPREVRHLRHILGTDFLLVTPGIRPARAVRDDQKRTMTPREAVDAGASYLVIGRPVTAASDPVAALQAIGEELA